MAGATEGSDEVGVACCVVLCYRGEVVVCGCTSSDGWVGNSVVVVGELKE